MTATATKKTAAPRKVPETAEVREPVALTDETPQVALLRAEIASLQHTIDVLRENIVIIGEGMAEEASSHGRSYCEEYEGAVIHVAGRMTDDEAREAFQTSGVRKYFTLQVPFAPYTPPPETIRVRAGSFDNAVASFRANPWNHVTREVYFRREIDFDAIELIGEPVPVEY